MKMKPHQRVILQEAIRLGVDYAFYDTGGRGPHPRLYFAVNGHATYMTVGRSKPSDVRSVSNALADLRRVIKTLRGAA